MPPPAPLPPKAKTLLEQAADAEAAEAAAAAEQAEKNAELDVIRKARPCSPSDGDPPTG